MTSAYASTKIIKQPLDIKNFSIKDKNTIQEFQNTKFEKLWNNMLELFARIQWHINVIKVNQSIQNNLLAKRGYNYDCKGTSYFCVSFPNKNIKKLPQIFRKSCLT